MTNDAALVREALLEYTGGHALPSAPERIRELAEHIARKLAQQGDGRVAAQMVLAGRTYLVALQGSSETIELTLDDLTGRDVRLLWQRFYNVGNIR